MRKRNKSIECDECGQEFTVKHNTTEAVAFCPFCGGDIPVLDVDEPPLEDMSEIDSFDPDLVEDEEDEEWDEES